MVDNDGPIREIPRWLGNNTYWSFIYFMQLNTKVTQFFILQSFLKTIYIHHRCMTALLNFLSIQHVDHSQILYEHPCQPQLAYENYYKERNISQFFSSFPSSQCTWRISEHLHNSYETHVLAFCFYTSSSSSFNKEKTCCSQTEIDAVGSRFRSSAQALTRRRFCLCF